MSEIVEEKYKSLVKQVYIDPIRTVVVVDDDFPTLDSLLDSSKFDSTTHNVPEVTSDVSSGSAASSGPAANTTAPLPRPAEVGPAQNVIMSFKGQLKDIERVKGLLKLCREHTPPWMIDVHDGSEKTGLDELQLAPSLHQSDLMILDFHLNGDSGTGDRAIEILKRIANNDQFNLVVVYTKGIAGNIKAVFEQIAVSLAYRDWTDQPSLTKLEATEILVKDWEDEDTDLEVGKKLLESFSTFDYLRTRNGDFPFEESAIKQSIENLLEKCPEAIKSKFVEYPVTDAKPRKTCLSVSSLFDYVVMLRHKELQPLLSTVNYGDLGFNIESEHNWMRLDKIFITVVDKTTAEPSALESYLLKALESWAPGPHQLLMGRMRAELSEKGVCAEGAVLANRPLQAGWLHELLDTRAEAEVVMTQSINRHWEALGDRIYGEVKRFAKEMLKYFREDDQEKILRKYMPAGVKEEDRLAHLNHYYSTKPIDSSHLTTGQIFTIDDSSAKEGLKYWICLSPACDLVPGQKKSGWKQRLGHAMPFIAVQLEESALNAALREINQNRFVLLEQEQSIKAFKFTTDSHSTSLPVWEHMFAGDGGKFTSEQKNSQPILTVQRMREEEGQLKMFTLKATVVCQLRYEYALNLLQRLGSALSRVGLDFRSM